MNPDFLTTTKRESFKTWKFRMLMNFYPMYFGTGGKILFWASDFLEVHLRLRLNLWSYNYVGTIFGGSMFAASDPFYMLMLFKTLGSNFVVWDKSANIRFKKPARETLYTRYLILKEDLDSIRQEVKEKNEVTRTFIIQWKDKNGIVHAEIERVCYIADKAYYQQKKGYSQRAKLEFKLNGND